MMPEERLRLIRVKVERARKHTEELDLELTAFRDSNPYEVGVKPHSEPPHHSAYYLISIQDVPVVIPAIAGDVLFNLRAALDHLAVHLVQRNGQTPTRYTSFPIIDTDNPAQYNSAKARKVQGMSDAAKDAIDATKPYKGGDDTLWRLHKLNNIDKHRALMTAVAQVSGMAWDTRVRRQMIKGIYASSGRSITDAEAVVKSKALLVAPDIRRCPLKASDILYVDPFHREADDNVRFAFEVAFYEPPIIECEPLLATLRNMADHISRLIMKFEPLLA